MRLVPSAPSFALARLAAALGAILAAGGTSPACAAGAPDPLTFASPPAAYRPETWFHLIGGNVARPGLTADLEAIRGAGIAGIQLFHGSGSAWPGVTPQVQTLSPAWDDMIRHVANETRRLGLRFTMQNCPGWAMSGGPWITPDKAMRHLIWSRTDVTGGAALTLGLAQPQPSQEDWRDYRDVAVIAFPTPAGDDGEWLRPTGVKSNRPELPWADLFAGKADAKIRLAPGPEPAWLEVSFDRPVTLRSLELPSTEVLTVRRIFDPAAAIRVQALDPAGLVDVARREVPRGTWQDRAPDERPLVLAFPDHAGRTFRMTFENKTPLELPYLRLSSAARVHDWQGQAGYVLRSLDRSPPPAQDRASWVSAASILDLSRNVDANGTLAWTPPAGRWTVLRFGHVNTGVKNKPAPPEATGFECDKFSPAGAEQHFAGYIGRISAPGGPADGGRLQGMLIDSWECFTQSWTPAMETEFAARRGYALRAWLPALAGWIVGDHLTSERFLRDWRATISDLLVHNYFGRLASLARTRGMKLSFEAATGDVSPGDILEYYGKADIPMCEFWHPNDPHWGGLETKPIAPATSAAHLYGKPVVAAEAFTNVGLRWDEHPFMLKHLADRNYALGVNHLVFHTYTHNPRLDRAPGTSFGSRIGTPFIRGQTWWRHMPHFTAYLARCEFMLQQGQPVADVLWYLGDDVDHKPRSDAPFPNGYKFDYLNADTLLHRLSVVDGTLRTPEGVSWKVLWLPSANNQRLTLATLTRLRALLQQGATIIGAAPNLNASLSGGAEAERAFPALVRELWGTPGLARGDRRLGQGRLVWGDTLEATLARLGVLPDVVGASAATWCHRQADGNDLYFVAADRLAPLQANLHFRSQGQPEFWDPLTGTSTPVALYHRTGTHTSIPLDLPAAGSVFVVFRPGPPLRPFARLERDGAVLADARDATRVDPGTPAAIQGLKPGEILQPWVENPLPACELIDGGRRLLAWEGGRYTLTRENPRLVTTLDVKGPRMIPLAGPWTLSFAPGWDAPAQLPLPTLKPWSALEDPSTRAFSGSATYACTVNLDAVTPDTRLRLDLGRVAVIAEVTVNGRAVATLWSAPFRADITPYVKTGANRLEIKVTNTWYNRLIFDAGLPKDQQKTWAINTPAAATPLELAGLAGPVLIRVGSINPLQP